MSSARLLAIAVVVVVSGCVINPGAPSSQSNDLQIENKRAEPVTVRVTVLRDGEVVYNESHTVEDQWRRENLVERGPEYTLRANVSGGYGDQITWNTETACGSPKVVVEDDEVGIAIGPC